MITEHRFTNIVILSWLNNIVDKVVPVTISTLFMLASPTLFVHAGPSSIQLFMLASSTLFMLARTQSICSCWPAQPCLFMLARAQSSCSCWPEKQGWAGQHEQMDWVRASMNNVELASMNNWIELGPAWTSTLFILARAQRCSCWPELNVVHAGPRTLSSGQYEQRSSTLFMLARAQSICSCWPELNVVHAGPRNGLSSGQHEQRWARASMNKWIELGPAWTTLSSGQHEQMDWARASMNNVELGPAWTTLSSGQHEPQRCSYWPELNPFVHAGPSSTLFMLARAQSSCSCWPAQRCSCWPENVELGPAWTTLSWPAWTTGLSSGQHEQTRLSWPAWTNGLSSGQHEQLDWARASMNKWIELGPVWTNKVELRPAWTNGLSSGQYEQMDWARASMNKWIELGPAWTTLSSGRAQRCSCWPELNPVVHAGPSSTLFILARAQSICSCWPELNVVHAGPSSTLFMLARAQSSCSRWPELNPFVHAGQLNLVCSCWPAQPCLFMLASSTLFVHAGQLNLVHTGPSSIQFMLASSGNLVHAC